LTQPRLAIVVSHPIQHFCPLYRALAEKVQLRVFFGSSSGASAYFDPSFNRTIQWAGDLLSGFDHRFFPGAESVTPSRPVDSRFVAALLREFDPEFVQVYGFYHPISWRALMWAKLHRRTTMLISDSERRTRRSAVTRIRKMATVPFLLRLVDRFLTVGDCNEDYYSHYGASPSRFYRSPFPVDSAALLAATSERVRIRHELRQELGVPPDSLLALVVGKLTQRKAPLHVLQALRDTETWDASARTPIAVFVGDGPERRRLQAFAAQARRDIARFPGFINTDALPRFYAGADFLVHPSSEDPHPLATAEAACAGLPMIVSNRVGSVGPTDDVRPGVNAFEYEYGDIRALGACISQMSRDPGLRSRFAAQSSAIGRTRTLEASANGYLRALLR
jgi:glycosyltransferase involved in cell wall biosynthesis